MGNRRQPQHDIPDAALMLRVGRGDGDAFAVLYHRHYRKLLDFFYAMSGSASTAEDLCQECFLRVWRLRERYAPTGSVVGYLFTIGRYVWYEQRPKIYRDQRVKSLSEAQVNGFDATDSRALPDALASRVEIEEAILKAVAGLTEDQRMAFLLRTIQGLPLEEIARVMACPVNTVRSRKLSAMKRLREALRGLLVL
ncbi:MAG: RNA polymerase sigma factor [Candidatus Hydrogenedentes bacterium]|nr:RNA polymerase sigma factor [Candidatus Hydrogenedentota bacterium]